jgi:D-proline reductase (dithiol) PrdB
MKPTRNGMKNSFRKETTVLLAKAFTRWPLMGRLWSKMAPMATSADVPWTQTSKPLTSCRICLITTGGLHLKTDPPFNMDDPQGDPTFRVIPAHATQADLTITHNYYNHADADRDFNILLPLDRVRELALAGHLGGVTSSHYSFMGHIDGRHVGTLEKEVLPALAGKIRAERADLVFLTPA